MKIITKINGLTCLMEIEGAIVGTYAEELDRIIRSTDFARLGVNNLVFNLSRATMIDSIGLEAINHAQEQGLKVSIFNAQELVKDILERAMINGRLAPFLQIVEKKQRVSASKEMTIPRGLPVSC
jgi:anti-anti-sigma regulatory factor